MVNHSRPSCQTGVTTAAAGTSSTPAGRASSTACFSATVVAAAHAARGAVSVPHPSWKSARVVSIGVFSAGSWCPMSTKAFFRAAGPTAAISRSVAVLSLIAIIFSAASCTVTVVPVGASCSSPEGRLRTSSVTVSTPSHASAPFATWSATAPST